MTEEFEGSVEEFEELANASFAQEWKARYMHLRMQMIPDVARWVKLLHYFHPTTLEHHWQDSFGNPLPKLYESEGLSVEIYNWCRPIIEVYGSLLAGQKPFPFEIDIPPSDETSEAERARAEAQEKVLMEEMYNQRIPLHFMDFCTSVVMFGIGWVYSWIDPQTRRLKTQALAWPGDVLPQWGSDRYGAGSDALESVIITERIPLESAKRQWPDVQWQPTGSDIEMRPDGISQFSQLSANTMIMKVWWRWSDETQHIGYAEVAYDGTVDDEPAVLYRENDTGYPDIPVRWASRFNTPNKAPHQAAGVLDDVIGINTEYNERLSAFSDMLMKLVYPKYKGKGYTVGNVPRVEQMKSNIIPMGYQQDILPLIESVNNFPFDSFLNRLETMMMTVAGLSRLMMGSMPPGDTSGEALNNLLHAAIGRLEIIRTPIQWAWTGLVDTIWVPLLLEFGVYSGKDSLGKAVKVDLKGIFAPYTRTMWIWPDVTPRDALKAIGVAQDLVKAGMMSTETGMKRARITSTTDELEKIRQERQDDVLNPEATRQTLISREMEMKMRMQRQATASAEQQVNAADNDSLKAEAAMTPTPGQSDNQRPENQGPLGLDNENAEI